MRWSERFGADTGRVFELFAAPPEKEMDWTDSGAKAPTDSWPRLSLRHAQRRAQGAPEPDRRPIARCCASCIRRCSKITDDFEGRWHFNTSIAALMELVNVLTELEKPICPRQ